MGKPYSHPALGEEEEAVSGHSVLTREERLRRGDRDVLYVAGAGVFDTSCCGAGGCAYAIVPGTVVRWKYAVDKDGRPVSEVEPVTDPGERRAIEEEIRSAIPGCQVRFLD